ncbi:MAG: DUF512 domain-containing protein, partial [Oscillospiraceae bacterium]|nr:DUF512 domain-containing protein [Oscillospiraceae bacterium]
LDRLDEAGIEYHAQIVLCPGWNDGAELDKTIGDLLARRPHALSLAVVPVGLTRFRAHCAPLTGFDRPGAARVVEQVSRWQEEARAATGAGFVYLADEFYLLAGLPLPEEDAYDGFPQLDNGVGLARSFVSDWRAAERENEAAGYDAPLVVDIICGTSVAPVFRELLGGLSIPGLSVRLLPVENRFFGPSVTVSGLLTGADILAAISSDGARGDAVVLPRCALRTGEDVFLDDMTLASFTEECGREVRTALSGGELYRLLTRWHDTPGREPAQRTYMWQSNAAYTPHIHE